MCFESFLVRLPFQKFQISPKLITYFLKHILEKIFFDEVEVIFSLKHYSKIKTKYRNITVKFQY